MADYRDEQEAGGGGFMMGLLTGTVLGAGIGMLLAPKSGSELRNQIGEQASSLGRRAGGAVNEMTERARESMHRGADQIRRRVSDATGAVESVRGAGFGSGVGLGSTDTTTPGSGGPMTPGGSTYTGTPGGFDPDRP